MITRGFVTFFEGFFNDFRDFLAGSDKNLTMAGKAICKQVIGYSLLVIHYQSMNSKPTPLEPRQRRDAH